MPVSRSYPGRGFYNTKHRSPESTFWNSLHIPDQGFWSSFKSHDVLPFTFKQHLCFATNTPTWYKLGTESRGNVPSHRTLSSFFLSGVHLKDVPPCRASREQLRPQHLIQCVLCSPTMSSSTWRQSGEDPVVADLVKVYSTIKIVHQDAFHTPPSSSSPE